MFISERGLWRYARLALCAATVSAVSTSGSLGKQPNQQPAAPEQTTKLDTTTGFRGQKFGTSFSEFQGLTLEKDEGDSKLYTKDENLQLGPAKLERVVYHFFQDKFFAVSLHTHDRDTRCACCASRKRPSARDWRPNAKDDLDQNWLGKLRKLSSTSTRKRRKEVSLSETTSSVPKWKPTGRS